MNDYDYDPTEGLSNHQIYTQLCATDNDRAAFIENEHEMTAYAKYQIKCAAQHGSIMEFMWCQEAEMAACLLHQAGMEAEQADAQYSMEH